MIVEALTYVPRGDKKNSEYFNEYSKKIYERRISSGLNDLIEDMAAVIVHVNGGDALNYLKELYWMTPYRFEAGFTNNTHNIYCLANKNQRTLPLFIVLEPIDPAYEDCVAYANKLYMNSRDAYNARYIGEIYKTKNKDTLKSVLLSHDFRFVGQGEEKNSFYATKDVHFTNLSNFTFNRVGYTDVDLLDFDRLSFGKQFSLTTAQQDALIAIDGLSAKASISSLIKGIDHIASRVLAGEREDAILEYLCLSKYYFWGGYNIFDMDSSTNVNRVPHGNDILSPAKVFTSNNLPFMMHSFANLPMPTETFVRNSGHRTHHLAYQVIDGDHSQGEKNIDYVVKAMQDGGKIEFLSHVYGACKDEPDLKQIFAKHSRYSMLITEYVERCHGFDNFFSKGNVTALTSASALDEQLKTHTEQHGLIGD